MSFLGLPNVFDNRGIERRDTYFGCHLAPIANVATIDNVIFKFCFKTSADTFVSLFLTYFSHCVLDSGVLNEYLLYKLGN